MNSIFPVFYLGSIEFYAELIKHKSIIIEQQEHFPKQTYRSRCEILGANGKLKLLLPIVKNDKKKSIKNVGIFNGENWKKLHWKSIEAAYRSSPYFEFYEDDFYPFYHTPQNSLFTLNLELHKTILRLLQVEQKFSLTTDYTPIVESDYRNYFNTKQESTNDALKKHTYIQVFNDRMPFHPNLSIIDLLFNEGPNSLAYLKQITR